MIDMTSSTCASSTPTRMVALDCFRKPPELCRRVARNSRSRRASTSTPASSLWTIATISFIARSMHVATCVEGRFGAVYDARSGPMPPGVARVRRHRTRSRPRVDPRRGSRPRCARPDLDTPLRACSDSPSTPPGQPMRSSSCRTPTAPSSARRVVGLAAGAAERPRDRGPRARDSHGQRRDRRGTGPTPVRGGLAVARRRDVPAWRSILGVLKLGRDGLARSRRIQRQSRAVADLIAVAVELARLAATATERSDWFERMAHTDPLTGLANERTFGRILELELARAARQGARSRSSCSTSTASRPRTGKAATRPATMSCAAWRRCWPSRSVSSTRSVGSVATSSCWSRRARPG